MYIVDSAIFYLVASCCVILETEYKRVWFSILVCNKCFAYALCLGFGYEEKEVQFGN